MISYPRPKLLRITRCLLEGPGTSYRRRPLLSSNKRSEGERLQTLGRVRLLSSVVVWTKLRSSKCTDKRTDVWSRDFMIWKIKFGLWAVGCDLGWTVGKKVWADFEQLLRPVFSLFQLIICQNPFIPRSSPGQRPTAENWFSISWNLGTRDLFSYLCI